jgi:hypothetical protein
MKCFYVLWKEEMFYDETIKMITECIATCHEIILFGHGYKSHSLRGAKDQFEDVESNKVLQHSPVILILYHTEINFNSTSNSMFDSEFELFEVSILIEYLFGPYQTSQIR